jgi:hypothetical protein
MRTKRIPFLREQVGTVSLQWLSGVQQQATFPFEFLSSKIIRDVCESGQPIEDRNNEHSVRPVPVCITCFPD